MWPAFWFEAKTALDWLTSEAAASVVAVIFQQNRDREVKANDHIKRMVEAAEKEQESIAAALKRKRQQNIQGPSTPPRKRQRTEIHDSDIRTTMDISIPDELLPVLIYFNEPLVLEESAEEYNPAFLQVIRNETKMMLFAQKHGEGLEKLRQVYLRYVSQALDDHRTELHSDLYSPPQDSKDETYRPAPSRSQDVGRSPYLSRSSMQRPAPGPPTPTGKAYSLQENSE
ncbi:hypothetical protein BT96DRAFT_948017 [Gymnopus androsaceus JB14]|uniref:Uncharacterized protein n=1 Tax=Gymnopus androsaceus JB14 TaxID=1447944 RepID=A0A6A4GRB3_9AGAR|nr:hypothetical protein BT96DRAFT_948017 [Gymnopus androsaceus JB14]